MNDNYATDEWILKLFEGWFDPCSLSNGELRKFDGLGSSWKDKTFVNPPYSKPIEWVRKAIQESNKGKMIVLLLRVDTSTEWFKLLVNADAHILWINKRLKHRTGSPANFPSMLAILKKEDTQK